MKLNYNVQNNQKYLTPWPTRVYGPIVCWDALELEG